VTIVRRALEQVRAHAAAQAPRECCGMLIGTPASLVESVPARNLAEGNTRFLIDPRDHIEAIRHARAASLDVVGFYHSHPRSRAYPSETDIAECGYAGGVHLIVGGDGMVRLFQIDGQEVTELPLHVTVVDDVSQSVTGRYGDRRI
jgi:proteasome lid subunit RPN8/RPN11